MLYRAIQGGADVTCDCISALLGNVVMKLDFSPQADSV